MVITINYVASANYKAWKGILLYLNNTNAWFTKA